MYSGISLILKLFARCSATEDLYFLPAKYLSIMVRVIVLSEIPLSLFLLINSCTSLIEVKDSLLFENTRSNIIGLLRNNDSIHSSFNIDVA